MLEATKYVEGLLNWAINFVPKLIGAIIVFIVGFYLINLISRLTSKALSKRGIDISLQTFLSSMVSVGLKVLLLISVAGMLGIETTSFIAVVGALGLAVGLALQGSLANFAGGVLVLVFKPFKIGDLIESGGQLGVVTEIQIFNTILLTGDNKTVILANGVVSNNTIVNYSKHGSLRVDITIAIAAENDIKKARQIALDTIKLNKFVQQEPAATVNVQNVGNGIITLAIRPYATAANYGDAFFTVQEDIKEAFDKNEITTSTAPTTVVINK